jgi:hypothetical protein
MGWVIQEVPIDMTVLKSVLNVRSVGSIVVLKKKNLLRPLKQHLRVADCRIMTVNTAICKRVSLQQPDKSFCTLYKIRKIASL